MFKRNHMKGNFLLIAALCLMVNGCSTYKIYMTPADVLQLPSDKRIWYEEGAHDKAKLISSILDEKIDKIIKTHYRPFKQPIEIYVFSHQESFEEFALQSRAGGEAHRDKILISPKKQNTAVRLPGIVVHELSHYHIFGYLGLYKSRVTPRWFLEGLAVWVSNGAGSERVTRYTAIKEILSGKQIKAVTRHPILFGEKSQPSGMKPHMFYRQSALFIEYLYKFDPDRFKVLLQGVEDRASFDDIFSKAYDRSPATMWNQFVEDLKNNQAYKPAVKKCCFHNTFPGC